MKTCQTCAYPNPNQLTKCFKCGTTLTILSDEQIQAEAKAEKEAKTILLQKKEKQVSAEEAEYWKQRPTFKVRSATPSITALGVFSALLIVIGVALLITSYNMTVTVTTPSSSIGGVYIESTTVNNIGLMDDRRNGITAGFGVLFIGITLAIVDHFTRLRIAENVQRKDSD